MPPTGFSAHSLFQSTRQVLPVRQQPNVAATLSGLPHRMPVRIELFYNNNCSLAHHPST
jgi:hypothetical protein